MVMRPIVYRSLRPLNSYLTSFHMSVHLLVDILDRCASPGAQILRLARQDDTTIVEEHDVVEKALDIGNHLRRQDHRTVSAEVGYQRIQNLGTRQGIQPSEGLVQDVEPCPAGEDQRQPRLLDHPPGQRADLLAGSETHDGKQLLEALPVKVVVEVRIEVTCLADRHPPVEMVHVRQKRDYRLCSDARHHAVDKDAPRRWRHQACEDLHERRLPTAVGAKQSHDMSFGHLQRDVGQCRRTDIALRKAADLYEHAHFFSFLAVSAAIAAISSGPYPSERIPVTYVATMSRASLCRSRSTVSPSPDTKVPMPRCVETYPSRSSSCLLYTSDAADDLLCVDLGGRRIIKKK